MTNKEDAPDHGSLREIRLTEEALALPPDRRELFVRERCGDNVELARTVLSLLSRYRREETSRDAPSGADLASPSGGGGFESSSWRGFLDQLESRGSAHKRYSLQGEVARGGMGVVFRVFDEDIRRPLAMKVILGSAGSTGDTPPVDDQALGRFLEEAQVTGQLDHPGIVPVHDVGLDQDGRVYFTMKLVKGQTLNEIIRLAHAETDDWSISRVVSQLLRVAEAMSYAHEKGVIHRDLKPANIMIGRFGEVYVMDWGLARVLGTTDTKDIRLHPELLASASTIRSDRKEAREDSPDSPFVTMDGDVVGTPAYMSPEQAEGAIADVGPRSDVYSVGAILYHLLTGQVPYVRPGARVSSRAILTSVLQGPPNPVHKLAPDAPAELVAICEKAMRRDPLARYESMKALSRDVSAYLDNRVVVAHKTGPVAELKKWAVRNSLAAFAIVGALMLIIASAVILVTQQRLHSSRMSSEREAAVALADELVVTGAVASIESDPARALASLLDLSRDSARSRLAKAAALAASVRGLPLLAGVDNVVGVEWGEGNSLVVLRDGGDLSEWALGSQIYRHKGSVEPPDAPSHRFAGAGRHVRSMLVRSESGLCMVHAAGDHLHKWTDGSLVAYVAKDLRWNDRASSRLTPVILDADGRGVEGLYYSLTTAMLSPDGRTVAFVDNNALALLDVSTGNTSMPKGILSRGVRDVVWSPEGGRLAVRVEGKVIVCDHVGGILGVRDLGVGGDIYIEARSMEWVNARKLACAVRSGLIVWDVESGNVREEALGVSSMTALRRGPVLAVGRDLSTVHHVHASRTVTLASYLPKSLGNRVAPSVSASETGEYFAVSTKDHLVIAAPDGRVARMGLRGPATIMEWSADGACFAVVDANRELQVWSPADLFSGDVSLPSAPLGSSWSPDGRWFATTSVRGVLVYDTVAGSFRSLPSPGQSSPNGSPMFAGSSILATQASGKVAVWQLAGDSYEAGLRDFVALSATHVSNGLVRCFGFGGSVADYDLSTRRWSWVVPIQNLSVHDREQDVAWLGTTEVAFKDGEGHVRTWNVDTSRAFVETTGPKVPYVWAAVDGKVFYLEDDAAKAWDPATGRTNDIGDWSGDIDALRVPPNGSAVVGIDDFGALTAWDVGRGLSWRLKPLDYPYQDASWLGPGSIMAVLDKRGGIGFWDYESGFHVPTRVVNGVHLDSRAGSSGAKYNRIVCAPDGAHLALVGHEHLRIIKSGLLDDEGEWRDAITRRLPMTAEGETQSSGSAYSPGE